MQAPAKAAVAFVLAFAAAAAVAQQPTSRKSEPPRRDPEAVKRLAAHDALLYVPSEEGLKDLSFTLKHPLDVLVDFRWRAPSSTAWSIRIPERIEKVVADKLRITVASAPFRAEMDAQTPAFVRLMTGERESAKYAEDALEFVAPDKVRIVAHAEATRAVMREATLTFDAAGRVVSGKVTSPLGAVSETATTYLERKGKFVVAELKATTPSPEGPQTATMTHEYAEVEGFLLLKRLVMKNGLQGDQELEFVDHKPNAGLKDEDFKK